MASLDEGEKKEKKKEIKKSQSVHNQYV